MRTRPTDSRTNDPKALTGHRSLPRRYTIHPLLLITPTPPLLIPRQFTRPMNNSPTPLKGRDKVRVRIMALAFLPPQLMLHINHRTNPRSPSIRATRPRPRLQAMMATAEAALPLMPPHQFLQAPRLQFPARTGLVFLRPRLCSLEVQRMMPDRGCRVKSAVRLRSRSIRRMYHPAPLLQQMDPAHRRRATTTAKAECTRRLRPKGQKSECEAKQQEQ